MEQENNSAHSAAPKSQSSVFKHSRKLFLFCIFILVLIACAATVYTWQHKKVLDLDGKIAEMNTQIISSNTQLYDQQAALAALPNIVEVSPGNTADLAVFLGTINTGCFKQASNGRGWYKVDKEVNDEFAEMQYGCETTHSSGNLTFILAKKTSGIWSMISPTNQWATVNGVQYPSCTMVNDNKISKKLEPKCYVSTTVNGAAQNTLQDVKNP